jgi:hypothetical protein
VLPLCGNGGTWVELTGAEQRSLLWIKINFTYLNRSSYNSSRFYNFLLLFQNFFVVFAFSSTFSQHVKLFLFPFLLLLFEASLPSVTCN